MAPQIQQLTPGSHQTKPKSKNQHCWSQGTTSTKGNTYSEFRLYSRMGDTFGRHPPCTELGSLWVHYPMALIPALLTRDSVQTHLCPPDAGLCPDVWQALWRSWRLADIETCLLISWKRRMRAPVCRETLSLKGSLYPFCDQHCWERASTFLVYLMQEFRHYCLLEHIFSGRENEIKQKQIMKSMFFRTVSVINNYYFWGGMSCQRRLQSGKMYKF